MGHIRDTKKGITQDKDLRSKEERTIKWKEVRGKRKRRGEGRGK